MSKNFDQSIDRVRKDLRRGYLELMSGSPASAIAVPPLIAVYRDAGVDIAALDLLDRVKKWIANHGKAKKRAYLQKLHLEATQYFNGPGIGTWRTVAFCARVFRYSGRFWKAQKAYNVAFDMIGDFDAHDEEDKAVIADIFADYAEFRAYLGHPGEADDILASFPAGYLMGWHQWVRATAYHFWGYEQAQPFGTPGATNQPGPEDRYHDSNDFLAQARAATKDKELPPVEEIDTHLLQAANWGAILRRRKSHGGDVQEAQTEATKGLTTFLGNPHADVNASWSWEKERRGRLAIFYRKKLDGTFERQDIEDWRRKFRNHYRLNLKEAGLPDTYVPPEQQPINDEHLDGQVDDADDHGDDEGD